MKKLNIAKVRPLIQMAIEEDLGRGDMTSALLFENDTFAKANIVSREEIVVCGMDVAREIRSCRAQNCYDTRPSGPYAHRRAGYAQLPAKT